MPVNKAARVRHEIIDECLRTTTKKWSKQALLERVNERLTFHFGEEKLVSLSQLRYDLEDMQSEYGAPIETRREGNSVYYFYEDPEFSIQKLPVNEEDIQKLKQAVILLQQIKGFTISDEVNELIQKLERKIWYKEEGQQSIIDFEKPAIIIGLEYLEDLYHAIIRKTALKLYYQPFNLEKPQEWIIHPYLLKQYNNRWYLLGLFEATHTIGIYALDRIKKITVCAHPYIENTQMDSEAFFQEIIGVTIPANPVKDDIIIKVAANRAPYILTKPIHHSQKLIEKSLDGYIIIELNLIINPELISYLLSFGPDIQVLSPKNLVDTLLSKVLQMNNLYN